MSEKKKRAPVRKVSVLRKTFVDNYLIHFNAAQAYKETYGDHLTDGSAASGGSALLNEIDVQQYLKQKLDERKQQLNVDQSYVIRKLLEITEIDYVDSIQHLTNDQIDKIPPHVRKFIQSIKLLKNRTRNADGHENETEKYEVTFMSKDKALELLGKHTGAFMKDNVQGNYDLGRMGFTDALNALDI